MSSSSLCFMEKMGTEGSWPLVPENDDPNKQNLGACNQDVAQGLALLCFALLD